MKTKLPAILFLLSTAFSVVVYLKVAEISGHELLGVLAAIGFYMAVFALLCILFNNREKEGTTKSTWQELKELQEEANKARDESEETGAVAEKSNAGFQKK